MALAPRTMAFMALPFEIRLRIYQFCLEGLAIRISTTSRSETEVYQRRNIAEPWDVLGTYCFFHESLKTHVVASIRADYAPSAMLALLQSCSQVNEEVRLTMPACRSLICSPGQVHAGEYLNAVFGTILNPTSSLHEMLPRLQNTTEVIIEQREQPKQPEADATYWCLGSAKLSRELRQFVKDNPLIEQVIVLRKFNNGAPRHMQLTTIPNDPLLKLGARYYEAHTCRAKYLSRPESCSTHDWVFTEELEI